jgi:predicted transcriptional regulator
MKGEMPYWKEMDMEGIERLSVKEVKQYIYQYLYETNNMVSDIVSEVLVDYYHQKTPAIDEDKFSEDEVEEIEEFVKQSIIKILI